MIASITGNVQALHHPGDHRLGHWAEAGLLRPSLVQAKIVTIETSVIGRRLGRLSPDDLIAVDRGLREAFGLS